MIPQVLSTVRLRLRGATGSRGARNVRMLTNQMNELSPYIWGYAIVIIGSIPIWLVVYLMWKLIEKDLDIKLTIYWSFPFVVGIVERILYLGALQSGFGIFIGIWLTIKTVVVSPRWNGKKDTSGNKDYAKPKYAY